MNFYGTPLAIHPSFLSSIAEQAALPRVRAGSKVSLPKGSRVVYEELIGVLEPAVTRPLTDRLLSYADDDSVGAVAMYLDCPGGTISGTPETAEAMRRLKRRKPIHVFAENYCASAGIWVASQASTISASPSTIIGSIGVINVVLDESEFYKQFGVRVVTVTSSDLKAAGVPGTVFTPEQEAMLRRMVDVTFARFEAEISAGRNLTGDRLAAVTNADVWYAAGAKARGLIDRVELFSDWLDRMKTIVPSEPFADLVGKAALAQFLKLANAGLDEEHDDFATRLRYVPDATQARLQQKYPILAAEAAKFDRKETQ